MKRTRSIGKDKKPAASTLPVAEGGDEEDGPPIRSLQEMLNAALKTFEERINTKEGFRPTLAEYLKLLQMQRELDLELAIPREVTVTWVDPPEFFEET
jgi:hypothetical protein